MFVVNKRLLLTLVFTTFVFYWQLTKYAEIDKLCFIIIYAISSMLLKASEMIHCQ